MDRSEVGIIIPAFNEEATIAQVVADVVPYGQVIVVDDGSTDKTVMRAESQGAIVVSHEINKGYDQALNTGFAKADELNCKYAITFDADGEHDHSLIEEMVAHLEKTSDLVLGVRSRKNRTVEKIFAFFTKRMFGIADPFCGMKAYKMDLYYAHGGFDLCGSVGTQLMFYAVKRKHPFVQVPVSVANRRECPRFGGIIRGNWRLLKAIWNVLYGG